MPLPSKSFWQAQKASDLSSARASKGQNVHSRNRIASERVDTTDPAHILPEGRNGRQAKNVKRPRPHSQRPELPEHIYFHVPGPCAPKPRQSQSDKWKQRPCVTRYRAWADKARLEMRKVAGVSRLETARTVHVKVFLPMPASWPAKKKHEMRGTPHRQKPDASNLLKSCEDALIHKDETVYRTDIYKEWAIEGQERTEIYITT